MMNKHPSGATRVLLVFPGHPQHTPALPFSVLVLASYLKTRDISVDILDTRLTGNDYSAVACKDYDLIGLSVKTGEQLGSAIDICQHIRAKCPVPIVWGGPHATFFPSQTCASELVDFVVTGEGEATLYELVCALRDRTPLTEIPGLVYKDSGRVVYNDERPFLNMADLTLPAYDLVNLHQYQDSFQYFTIETSRGCPHRCGFCYVHEFHRRKWRAKPLQHTLHEIRQIIESFDRRKFFICDDNFFADKQRVLTFAQNLLDEGLAVEIFTQARADCFSEYTDRELSLLCQAGFKYVAIGAESGSQRMLDKIRKDITPADIVKTAQNCIRHDMIPVFSFVIGIPGEKETDLEKTIALYETLKNISPAVEINGFYLFTPYPGTALFQEAIRHGYTPFDSLEAWRDWEFSDAANLPWLRPVEKHRLMVLSRIILFLFIYERFHSYGNTFQNKKLGTWYWKLLWRLGSFPLRQDARFRLKKRWFTAGYEWLLFGQIAGRVQGSLK